VQLCERTVVVNQQVVGRHHTTNRPVPKVGSRAGAALGIADHLMPVQYGWHHDVEGREHFDSNSAGTGGCRARLHDCAIVSTRPHGA
jgi:hypothetical protein